MTRRCLWMICSAALVAASVPLLGSAWARQRPAAAPGGATGRVTLSIVGTTDLHGRVFPDDGRGGLALLGGYLRNLREARAADGGAVLLLDAGDTFQGGIASDISEGALVVDAYNALGYDALAIGNHEFEYGAIETASGDGGTPDMRGALKAAAARARFPFLAANLIDTATGRRVEWSNVRPSHPRRRRGSPGGHRRGHDSRRAHEDARRQRPGARHGGACTHRRERGPAPTAARRRSGAGSRARRRRLRTVRRSHGTCRRATTMPRSSDWPGGYRPVSSMQSSPDTPTGRWRTTWPASRLSRPFRWGERSRASI